MSVGYENVDNLTLFTAAQDAGYLGTYSDFEGIAAAGETSDLFEYLDDNEVCQVTDPDEAGFSIYFDEGGCSMEDSMDAENAAYNEWCDSLNARRGRL